MALIAAEGLRVVWRCSRNFSISCIHRNWETQGRFMKKLMSNNLQRKIQSTHNAGHAVKLLDKKRAAVLSKMYMLNVSEVLSLGDFPEVIDKGIQITRVSVMDTGSISVFWLAGESEDPIEVETFLASIAGKVRNKLMYANMMGNMPKIVFKRDLSAVNTEETLKLLHKVSQDIKRNECISLGAESDSPESLSVLEVPVPQMRMDTYGLHYNNILTRIKDAKRKAYPLQAPVPPSVEEFQESVLSNSQSSAPSVEAQFQRKKELQRFIRQYQKSALSSNARERNLKFEDDGVFYYEEDSAEEDCDDFEEMK